MVKTDYSARAIVTHHFLSPKASASAEDSPLLAMTLKSAPMQSAHIFHRTAVDPRPAVFERWRLPHDGVDRS
jgi:hypothetical protein